MERPHLDTLIGQTVTLHFPNGDYTTGTLVLNGAMEPSVNGWLVHAPGRFFSLANGTIYD